MQPEEKEILEETLELTKENNDMLHSIRRSMFWSNVMRVAYWIIIIGAGIGLFYFMQPYIDGLVSTYGDVKGNIQSSFGDLLK